MDKKTRPIYMLPARDPSQIERYTQTKNNEMEKDTLCKWKGKKPEVAVLISEKIDFKTKATVRDKEGNYIMIKGAIQQEDITLENIYAPKIEAPKYVKQILMDINREVDRITVIVGDFNTPLTLMSRSSRQKINKEIVVLIDSLDQMDLIGIFRAFHHKADNVHSFQVHMDHLLG